MVFNDKVYTTLFGGLSDSGCQILKEYCNLSIENISDDGMMITYKFIMPILYYDDYTLEFRRIEIAEEVISFKKEPSGWKLTAIPVDLYE